MDKIFEWVLGIITSILFFMVGLIYRHQMKVLDEKVESMLCEEKHREIGRRLERLEDKADQTLASLNRIEGRLKENK